MLCECGVVLVLCYVVCCFVLLVCILDCSSVVKLLRMNFMKSCFKSTLYSLERLLSCKGRDRSSRPLKRGAAPAAIPVPMLQCAMETLTLKLISSFFTSKTNALQRKTTIILNSKVRLLNTDTLRINLILLMQSLQN